ncbi:type II secretion system F family protein [Geomonas sp. Red32]|uniref:type II secretion system F family protein n=1 Tax=Geomonas sp. Red32 TaxID=2912856 RepID=UPI00202CA7E6|nr:type II secretion system F family protein [Geomonas sp. Red32]MCM0083895.1 type II secretion system F family protein [Geomonas sp. Red32]
MIATVLSIFGAVFLGAFALFFTAEGFRHSLELKRRVSRLASAPAAGGGGAAGQDLWQESGSFERLLARLPFASAVQERLAFSGVRLTIFRFLLLTGALSVTGFVVGYAWKGGILLPLSVAAALLIAPFIYLGHKKRERSARFAEQLPEALTMVARSLRAGHSLAAAVELVGQELPEPAGGLFKLAYEQQKLGLRITDALRSLSGRIDSVDYEFFVTIIRINIETGGNLAEILEKLAETIRSRLQIRRQVQVYTAEGRVSGYVLVAMPVVVFALFYLLRPSYMNVFFTQRICQLILGAAALGQVVGFLMIRKIIDIRI